MAQIFKPSANTLAKLSLMVVAAIPVVLIYAGSTVTRSPLNTNVEVRLNQPIPFNHLHHAAELGIDCRYCHTSVETSSSAGVPPTETCMSCHSQIWTNSPLLEPLRKSWETGQPIEWTRVNKVPEFVYFNHSIHIERGVNCNTCHGPVQKMPITYKGRPFQMVWCLQCHRNPEKFLNADPDDPKLSPRQQVFNLYWKQQAGDELSPAESALIEGGDMSANGDPEKGEKLVKKLKINVQQLEDCGVCHR